jgi:predicted nucleic acid-binding protein
MRLVDSSAWIEYLSGSALGSTLNRQFPALDEWLVPTIVQLELAKWLVREELPDVAEEVISYSEHCVVVALETATALSGKTCHTAPAIHGRCNYLRDRFGLWG